MNKNLEQKLADEFEFMRPKPENSQNGYISDLYSAFGCECGDGWFDLLRNLCIEIVQLHERNNLPVEVGLIQIKEKYGSLRFYAGIEHQQLSDEFYAIIGKYGDISEKTCEHCGVEGKMRILHCWLRVRCNNCWQQVLKNYGYELPRDLEYNLHNKAEVKDVTVE